MSGETFHDIAQPAQIRFDAERHRAPIRSFLVTRAWFWCVPARGAAAMCVASGLRTKALLIVLFQKCGAKVKEIDPVSSHASGMENFPWTRLAAVVFLPKRKSAVDVAKLHSMSPSRVRDDTRGGDFASY